MKLYRNTYYKEDLSYVMGLDLPWQKMKNKSILISGATGLIGRFLIDVLMLLNADRKLNIRLYALCRNMQKAQDVFEQYRDDDLLTIIAHDINYPLALNDVDSIHYVLHMASNTHPLDYAADPIGTVTTNIIGTNNMLLFAAEHNTERFVFTSSNEIYGENKGDVELFDEDYCGYIDCNTMRAGYPESKRCGEALCQAYAAQKGLDIVIPRLTRSYGPTLKSTDSKAMSQFIKNAIEGEDIVLKSEGTQYYSYTYVADAVSGLLTVILKGKSGEAYNIADTRSDIQLKDLASHIAECTGTNVIFDLPNKIEQVGFSKATKARLNGDKLKKIGWSAKYDIKSGLDRTIKMMREIGE